MIKYVMPNLSIPATATNAVIIVFLPTLIMASVLLWRWRFSPAESSGHATR
ncbi:hypothetical protein [Scytonema sp. PRP1]|uniref:hypothetical protein n=1 Tax=Scytonema sp. PRP1 TaxID=3120513 RepID=UPI003FA7A400